MNNNKLNWKFLLPNVTPYQAVFNAASRLSPSSFSKIQPRLKSSLESFCHPKSSIQFMILKAEETQEYLSLIAHEVKKLLPKNNVVKGSHYIICGNKINIKSAHHGNELFAAHNNCLFQTLIEPEQLFGCVRFYNNKINLEPGLVHQANGGILILSATSLLSSLQLWLRLKKIIIQHKFYWHSLDQKNPLPIHIPSMPLELRLIIVNNNYNLSNFYNFDSEISNYSIYGEYEDYLTINNIEDMSQWCKHVNSIIIDKNLPNLTADAWPLLITAAVRYSGDQKILPLSLIWIEKQLREATTCTKENNITAKAFEAATNAKTWREHYLSECIQYDIDSDNILIKTEGAIVGQINGLSILSYPGHPRNFGIPSRISCVVHLGEGEFVDVEHKVNLGGNIHAKSMMIVQSFLISSLDLDCQLPFSSSIVFEQSFDEVDGDSASLAVLCALISALSQQPINQEIAVTGSIDQFGNIQSIGGINEKIEGFFELCLRRGLTKNQGVIFPATNIRHLCLCKKIIKAVKKKQFYLWSINHVEEALPLLTGYSYSDFKKPNLLTIIKKRIIKINSQEHYDKSWLLRWLNFFK